MSWTPYLGENYLSYNELELFCREIAKAHPNWVSLDEIGKSKNGRPIYLLSIGDQLKDIHSKPAIWIDGGTHAAEWTGIMTTLYIVTKWVEGLSNNDIQLQTWFSAATAYVLPCMSPDGFAAMMEGSAFLRSSLRTEQLGAARSGFEACDINHDNKVMWMRWKHPAGPWVPDEEVPIMMRPRTLEDSSANAYFCCAEGEFINWDGSRWVSAPVKYGLDLNRNFPARWEPFNMFGMDGGDFALSEPESDATVRAFSARPFICAALTNHTYTGCLLTQPYFKNSTIPLNDIELMHTLAKQLVNSTSYKVYKVYPDFTYQADQAITGVWSDTMTTIFGIPAYTVEYWDPLEYVGEGEQNRMEFFMSPDPIAIRRVLAKFIEKHPDIVSPWEEMNHPQLGSVEIGGIDYMRSIRNPPLSKLKQECDIGFNITNKLRRTLPIINCTHKVTAIKENLYQIEVTMENCGFLSTSGLELGKKIRSTPNVTMTLELPDHLKLVSGQREQKLSHLHGWGNAISECGLSKHPIYPGLSQHGHRASAQWLIEGSGSFILSWIAGRAGKGKHHITLPKIQS